MLPDQHRDQHLKPQPRLHRILARAPQEVTGSSWAAIMLNHSKLRALRFSRGKQLDIYVASLIFADLGTVFMVH